VHNKDTFVLNESGRRKLAELGIDITNGDLKRAGWQNAPSADASASIVRSCAVHQSDTSGLRCIRCGASWSHPYAIGRQ